MTAEMVASAGTQQGSGVGLGLGGDGRVGIGVISTTHQSQLAKRYFLGPRPQSPNAQMAVVKAALAGLLGSLFLGVLAHNIIGLILFGLVVTVILALVFLGLDRVRAQRLAAWESRRAELHGLWVCMQCGNAWRPRSV